ncbi:DNA pol d PCNA [Enterospora canceri]|uniref:DNA sliding clamp PCNA n=1 Tax=Enterospora canceri TaxID=1081671 RepID=A0A1Y1SA39_9MICR|nr:DNA pol d PCNA [Enterospora canceri]
MLEIGISFSKKNTVESSYTMNVLKQTFSALEDLVENAVIKISHDGISAQVIDSMHVCLCDVRLSSELFTHFRCDTDVLLTVPLKSFNLLFKNMTVAKDGDSLMISAVEVFRKKKKDENTQTQNDSQNKATRLARANSLTLTNTTESAFLKTSIALLDSEAPEFMLPDTNFQNEIEISAESFRQMKNLGGLFGNKVVFKVQKDEFVVMQKGEGTESCLILKNNENKSIVVNSTMPTQLEINKQYLDTVQKILGLCDKMRVSMSPETPILFEMGLNEYGYIHFFIAPQA